MKRKIGILGGSFNPPHLGHLYIAEEARQRLKLDEVWILPVAQQPLKSARAFAASNHRLAMCKLLWRGRRGYRVADHEIRREGKSYSHETIAEFRRRYPGVSFFFLAGADCLEQLHRWRNLRGFAADCKLVLIARPGWIFTENKSARLLMGTRRYNALKHDRLIMPGFNVSATDIRKKIKKGEPVFHLVGNAVEGYIRRHRLYRAAY